jgi:flagellin-like hook-associated protein FlgL
MSEITLTSGMRTNLYALQTTNSLMELTQTRLSTGKRINTALDDPVNFFKAKGHQDRASDLAARKDGMSEGIKVIEAANTGIEAIVDVLAQMKALAQAAKTSDDSVKAELATQYNELKAQINDLGEDSGYGGTNLLNGTDSLTVEFNEAGDNSLTVTGIDAVTADQVAGETLTDAAADFANVDDLITEIDSAVNTLRSTAQQLSSGLSTIEIRSDFTDKMINTLESGADNLTLADMNEEGANMLMLQTRQALGTTSLSLSSQAAQSVLRLF